MYLLIWFDQPISKQQYGGTVAKFKEKASYLHQEGQALS